MYCIEVSKGRFLDWVENWYETSKNPITYFKTLDEVRDIIIKLKKKCYVYNPNVYKVNDNGTMEIVIVPMYKKVIKKILNTGTNKSGFKICGTIKL